MSNSDQELEIKVYISDLPALKEQIEALTLTVKEQSQTIQMLKDRINGLEKLQEIARDFPEIITNPDFQFDPNNPFFKTKTNTIIDELNKFSKDELLNLLQQALNNKSK